MVSDLISHLTRSDLAQFTDSSVECCVKGIWIAKQIIGMIMTISSVGAVLGVSIFLKP